MKKAFLYLILVALILAACAGQPAAADQPAATNPPAQESVPTALASATIPATNPTEPVQPAATDTQPASGQLAGSSGLRTFVILPEESKVSYQVNEVFLNDNNRLNTAIGITQVISGSVQIDSQNPQNSQTGDFSVDVSQFKSDSGRRDSTIRNRFLESSRFPKVTFKTTKVEGLPQSYTAGQEVKFKLSGDLTIRETTRPVTFDVTAQLNGDRLTGQAQTQILMSDFGFGPISLGGILKTEDQVAVTFDFVAVPKT